MGGGVLLECITLRYIDEGVSILEPSTKQHFPLSVCSSRASTGLLPPLCLCSTAPLGDTAKQYGSANTRKHNNTIPVYVCRPVIHLLEKFHIGGNIRKLLFTPVNRMV